MEPTLIKEPIKNQLIFSLNKITFLGETWVQKGSKGSSKKHVPLRVFATQTHGTIPGPTLTSEHDFRRHFDAQNVAKGVKMEP